VTTTVGRDRGCRATANAANRERQPRTGGTPPSSHHACLKEARAGADVLLVAAPRLIDELNRLPMRPGAAQRILQMLEDPDRSADDLARVIETDPALSARILRLANSPFFGLGGTVSSAKRAVIVLGLSVVRSLAVSTAAGLFDARSRQLPEGFWDHAIAVAAGAGSVATHLSVPKADAFSAGLLHDIGEVLIDRHAPDRAAAIRRACPGDIRRRLTMELHAFGGDHAEIGATVLATWSLPAAFVDSIRWHHTDPTTHTNRLAHSVLVGEVLAEAAGITPSEHQGGIDPGWVLAAVGIGAERLDEFVEQVRAEQAGLGALSLLAAPA
jgi:putative nucleotidyltransferase with HDIG domain